MFHLIKVEFTKIKYVYLVSIVIGILFCGIIIIPYTTGSSFNHNIELWDISSQFFCYMYPIFAVMPVCWLLYYERKTTFYSVYIYTSIKKKVFNV